MTRDSKRAGAAFGKNLVHIRTLSGWDRNTFTMLLSKYMMARERRSLRAHVKNIEDRQQRQSVLVMPISRLFGIPIHVLTTEDLTDLTLEALFERFGYDPEQVMARVSEFHVSEGDDID
jgi:hypothetical protein